MSSEVINQLYQENLIVAKLSVQKRLALASVALVPGVFPLPSWLFFPYVIGLVYLIYRHLDAISKIKREVLYRSYLDEESSLHQFNKQRSWIVGKNLAIALPIAFITAAYLSTAGILGIIYITVGILVGIAAAKKIAPLIELHANHAFKAVYIIKMSTASTVIGMALILIIHSLWVNLTNDFSQMSAAAIADTVINETNHPVGLVQDYARTIHFINLQTLRMCDTLGGKGGLIVYLYLILPNLFPLYGISSTLQGATSCVRRLSPNS